MQYFISTGFLIISCSLFIACSDNSTGGAEKEHVWKEQTETIDKAKEVEGMLMDSAEATRKAIEN